MAETNVNITAGSGTGIDTFNVGSGAVGSGTEALRQVVVIGDSVTQANVAAVKPASTAASGTDPALVVAMNPLNIVSSGLVPLANSGCAFYSFLSTAAVQAANIKNSAGQVYALQFFNNTATIAYIRLYNQTTSPASTDTANIIWRGLVPANASGAGVVLEFTNGLTFGSGIGIRVSAAVADNDTTALAANAILGNVTYK